MGNFQCQKTGNINCDEQAGAYYSYFYRLSLSNCIELEFHENEFLSGEECGGK